MITFEGVPPFSLIPMRGPTARVAGKNVELTLYVSDPRNVLGTVQIQMMMTIDDARQLSGQLTAAAISAEARVRKS